MPGLMIIAHAPLASALKAVAEHTFPECQRTLEALDVPGDMAIEDVEALARDMLARVRTPEAARFQALLGPERAQTTTESNVLEVHGLSPDEIGDLAFQSRVPIYELTPQQASLEEAFMNLTKDAVEFGVEATADTEIAA